MIIAKLLESLIGPGEEFEAINVYLSLDVLCEAQDLAAQIGVPTSRLIAELLPQAIVEARTEWRTINYGESAAHGPAKTPTLHFDPGPRVK